MFKRCSVALQRKKDIQLTAKGAQDPPEGMGSPGPLSDSGSTLIVLEFADLPEASGLLEGEQGCFFLFSGINQNQYRSKGGDWKDVNLVTPPAILPVINQCLKVQKFGD